MLLHRSLNVIVAHVHEFITKLQRRFEWLIQHMNILELAFLNVNPLILLENFPRNFHEYLITYQRYRKNLIDTRTARITLLTPNRLLYEVEYYQLTFWSMQNVKEKDWFKKKKEKKSIIN